jgi:hypothetical protein
MIRVAVVIVSYNSVAEIGGCLNALPPGIEVVVVDNASTDGTQSEVMARGAGLIANRANAGFAGAVNQGVRATAAPLILLLNPDTRLVRGLESMADCMAKPGTGAVGGMLIGEDGKPQTGFMARSLPGPLTLAFEVLGVNRLWPANRINRNYRCLALDPLSTAVVDQPAGAFMMFSRAVWEKVGGFDERFWPIWFEDVDFCARIKSAGFCAYYHPGGVAKHSGSHSIRALSLENRERYWYGSLLEYAAKHHHSWALRTTCVAVAAGAVLRAVTGFPRHGFKAFAVYGGIVGLALNRLFKRRPESRASVV